jgi:hypothetical protein
MAQSVDEKLVASGISQETIAEMKRRVLDAIPPEQRQAASQQFGIAFSAGCPDEILLAMGYSAETIARIRDHELKRRQTS